MQRSFFHILAILVVVESANSVGFVSEFRV